MHGIQLKWNLKPSHLVLRFLWEIHSIHSNSLNTFTRSRVWKHFTNSIEQTKQGQLHTTETLERISKIKKRTNMSANFPISLSQRGNKQNYMETSSSFSHNIFNTGCKAFDIINVRKKWGFLSSFGPAKYIRWGFYFKGLHKILYLEMERRHDHVCEVIAALLVYSVEFRNGMWTSHPDLSSPPFL